jgi:NADPH:quinone reductase-like Zn-dependent oxidoreductase
METGKVVSVIDSCYPLSELADGVRHWEEGNARGKIVITM